MSSPLCVGGEKLSSERFTFRNADGVCLDCKNNWYMDSLPNEPVGRNAAIKPLIVHEMV